MTLKTKLLLCLMTCLYAGVPVFAGADFNPPRVTPAKNAPRPPRVALDIPMDSAPAAALPPGAPSVPWMNERLKFSVGWGFLTVGYAEMWTANIVAIDSVPCYHIVSTAETTSVVDAFFKVRDKNQTWIAADTLYSMGYSKKIREGNYFWDEWVRFDTAKKTFTGLQKTNGDKLEDIVGELPGPVQDIFSAFYFVRAQPLEPGKSFSIDVNSSKNWPLYVTVHPNLEKVKVGAGKFECVVVEPSLRDKGIFVQKGRSLKVWITNDKRRLPVKMEAEVFIGHVSAELEEYSQ